MIAMVLGLATAQDFHVVESSKIEAPLLETFAASPGELVNISITMRDQAPANLMETARAIPDKEVRREYVTSVLKEIASETQGEVLETLQAGEAEGRVERVKPLWIANVVSARVDQETAFELAALDGVAYLHEDVRLGEEVLTTLPSSMVGGTPTCGVDLINAPQVWSTYGIDGTGVVAGVIDTGTCVEHPDINIWINPGEINNNGVDDDNNGYVDDIAGWNFENDNKDIDDNDSHGSHVAGTVAGDGTAGTQAGVAPGARIMTLRFWNSFSGESTVWEAHQYSVATGADLTTASLGWPASQNPDRAMWRMVTENAIAAGIVVLYAAGNEGACCPPASSTRTPGDVPDVITVGATDCSDNIAGFSSVGPVTWENVAPYNDFPFPPGKIKPTVCAEGNSTVSHSFCNGYSTKSGTSMATPHVAGVAALLLQADPSLDQFGVTDILTATAVDLGDPGNDNTFGWGRVDAFEAVTMALNGTCTDALCADVTSVSAASGGTQNLSLDAGSAFAGDTYLVLGSLSGDTPGTSVGALTLPLNTPDAYLDFTLANPNTGGLVSTLGTLDSNGEASASIVVPGGFAPFTAHHAFVVIDLSVPGLVSFASNAAELESL